ncbi:Hypothetical protein R9X50_00099400 [Acrodontium crateriforme]|uniref:Major facilitator superfamily (MFS) profile domain-containing protein n=1 Tax=Acrodontium crateriforme TaxID=150365 RepID=A0AAQ3M196_9PEZI|nr:Hypothetical protein R9X50_00099400 [Acrodontium crateriforme]
MSVYSDEFVMLAVGAAAFTDAFLNASVIPILPRILRQQTCVSPDQIQYWTSVSFATVGGTGLLVNVILALTTNSRHFKRQAFRAGSLFMVAATGGLFLAKHVGVIVVARALQGASTSILWVAGLGYLTAHVEQRVLGVAMGLVYGAIAIGDILGPIIGAVLYENAGWFAVMRLLLVAVAVDSFLRLLLRSKPEMPPHSEDEIDPLLQHGNIREETSCADSHCSRRMESALTKSIQPRDLVASWLAIIVAGSIRTALESTLPIVISRHAQGSISAKGGIILALHCPAVLSPFLACVTTMAGPRYVTTGGSIVLSAALVALPYYRGDDGASSGAFVALLVTAGTGIVVLTTCHSTAFSMFVKSSEIEAHTTGAQERGAKSFAWMSTAWNLSMLSGPTLADFMMENSDWETLCFLLAGLSVMTSIILACTWRSEYA